jgi:hypothetical protein
VRRLGVIVALGALLGMLGGVVTASPALAGREPKWQPPGGPPSTPPGRWVQVLGEDPGGQHPPRLRRVTSGGADHGCRVPCDEQISWPTAERTAPGLACVIPVGYSVSVWIDGKEKVYGSIP